MSIPIETGLEVLDGLGYAWLFNEVDFVSVVGFVNPQV